MGLGIGGHQSAKAKSVVWLTPQHILKPLGHFDLDPCSLENRPFDTADTHIYLPQNGLEEEWWGRVWLNPPYGRETGKWLQKLQCHGCGTAIIFARTDTKVFFEHVWDAASAVLFLRGRVTFLRGDGSKVYANSGAPSCLVAYGDSDREILEKCGLEGKLVRL